MPYMIHFLDTQQSGANRWTGIMGEENTQLRRVNESWQCHQHSFKPSCLLGDLENSEWLFVTWWWHLKWFPRNRWNTHYVFFNLLILWLCSCGMMATNYIRSTTTGMPVVHTLWTSQNFPSHVCSWPGGHSTSPPIFFSLTLLPQGRPCPSTQVSRQSGCSISSITYLRIPLQNFRETKIMMSAEGIYIYIYPRVCIHTC